MLDELDAERLRNPAPKGLLTVMVISASDLIVADLRSSDPYVKILYGPDQKYKTSVKKATLNPTWNEVRRPQSPTHILQTHMPIFLLCLPATQAHPPHTSIWFKASPHLPVTQLTSPPLLSCPRRSSR